jgi:hypothetical protein
MLVALQLQLSLYLFDNLTLGLNFLAQDFLVSPKHLDLGSQRSNAVVLMELALLEDLLTAFFANFCLELTGRGVVLDQKSSSNEVTTLVWTGHREVLACISMGVKVRYPEKRITAIRMVSTLDGELINHIPKI